MISLTTRSAICRSRWVSSRSSARKAAASSIGRAQISAMFLPPMVTANGSRLESRSVAGQAWHLAHETLEPLAARVALSLAMPAFDVRDDAFVLGVVRALASVAVLVAHMELGRMPAEDGLSGLCGKLAPLAYREREPELVGQGFEQAGEVVGDVRSRPRRDRAVGDRLGLVGDHKLGVDDHPGAEAVAHRAGTEGRVERERTRLELLGVDRVLVGACHPLGEAHAREPDPWRQIDEVEDDEAAGQAERGLDRVREPLLGGALDRQPVDDDLDGVLLLLVQGGRIGQRVGLTVDSGAGEALALQLTEEVDVLALATADDRREYLESHALVEGEDPVDDLLRRLPRDRASAHGAVRAARAGEQQAQVVVDLGDRADGRARVARRGLLVDGDRRRQALDEVDVGLVHLAQELPGVRRQRLDVATLTLGEDRVEREAGLARPGQPGEDDHGVARAGRARRL